MELKLINCSTIEEINNRELERVMKILNKATLYNKQLTISCTKKEFKKTVYWTVRIVDYLRKNRKVYYDLGVKKELDKFMEGFSVKAVESIKLLTYRQFMEIFLIDKTYDKTGYCKDYFSAKESLKDKNLDELIGENALDLIMDYHNKYLRATFSNYMAYINKLYKEDTGKDMLDVFFEGVEKHTMYEIDGKKFLMDSDGRTVPVKRSTGLKVIK